MIVIVVITLKVTKFTQQTRTWSCLIVHVSSSLSSSCDLLEQEMLCRKMPLIFYQRDPIPSSPYCVSGVQSCNK